MRTVLPAAILYLSDCADGPADLHVQVQALGEGLAIDLAITASARPVESPPALAYRVLQWVDVRTLAQAEGMRVERQPEALQLRWAGLGH